MLFVVFPLTALPQLSSLPGAPANLYLDFDGDVARQWASYAVPAQPAYNTDGDASTFSDVELADVRQAWSSVADAFAPFNLNVTTVHPGAEADVTGKTLRVVMAADSAWYGPGAGGVAYVNSFSDASLPNWCYIFVTGNWLGSYITHESGHAFGLQHQSGYDASGAWSEYLSVPGPVQPVMGLPTGARNVWRNGISGSESSHVAQDDMAIIAGPANGFGYRPDDYANAPDAATSIVLSPGGGGIADGATLRGVLHHHTDQDWFAFDWAGGPITLATHGAAASASVDPSLELRGADGSFLAMLTDAAIGSIIVYSDLPAGSYRVGVSPGTHDDGLGGLTTYGQAGRYELRIASSDTGGQLPFPGAPHRIAGAAATRIEAEDFDLGGEGVAYHEADALLSPSSRAGEGFDFELNALEGHVATGLPGEWLEYTVDVDATGWYDLVIRARDLLGAGGAIRFTVDGSDVTVPLAPPPGTADFQDVRTLIPLTAGRHVLRLAFDGATAEQAAQVNWMEFTPFVAPPMQGGYSGMPFVVGPSSVTIQAEDYDLGGQGMAYNDTTPLANTGGAYRTGARDGVDVKLINGTSNQYRIGDAFAGEWVEYTIDVASPGDYTLEFRLSQTEANAVLHAEIDLQDVTGPIVAPDTNSFSTFATVSRTVRLSAGTHVLRLAFDVPARNGTVAGVDWIRISPVPPPPPVTSTVTLTSNTAAYVRNGSYAGRNFGNDAQLIVKNSSSSGNTREAYLKFDISSLPTDPNAITSVKLRLYGRKSASGTSPVVGVFGASNTGWSEGSLTWNTRPATAGDALASKSISGTSNAWHEFDITAYARQTRLAGQQFVTLVLRATNTTDPQALFNSDDASGNKPRLLAQYTTPATPMP